MALRLFGLTGGIASGKSVVGRRFAARGVPVLDADLIARAVVAPGTEGLGAVVASFGPAVLTAEGALDRKRLAARVFSDPTERARLNAITHPLIAAATQAEAGRLDAAGARVACYEAALLVENHLADAFRPLVVVAASESTQVARAVARDGEAERDVRARVAAQLPLAEKTAVADVVIDNDADLSTLIARADDALDRVFALLGVDASAFPRP